MPFSAIKSFFDPSVQFGLQFEPSEGAVEATATNLPSAPASASVMSPAPAPVADSPEPQDKPNDGAEVVRLDRFRKK